MNQRGRFEVGLARQSADPQISAILAYIGKAGDSIDVDEVSGAGQPELHHWDQALAAAENLSVVTVLLQESDRFRNCLRAKILEGSRDHRRSPPIQTFWMP